MIIRHTLRFVHMIGAGYFSARPPTPAQRRSTVGPRPARPILFDVRLDATPPSYEILFLAELDSDHRIAQVPFVEVPASPANAFQHAFGEFRRLSDDDVGRLRTRAELIDRTRT